MKGDQDVLKALNSVLTKELTAINQYFLHARMLEDWGLDKIGHLEYKASIDEMKFADEVIKRILFLEGLPNLQKLDRIRIGQNVEEMLQADLDTEAEILPLLRSSIELCESKQDYVSRDLLAKILDSEEEHVDWLETQQALIEKVGVANYMQSQIQMKTGH